ncbi:DUF1643 domain-containing protein [Schlesneria sp. T3-172]|uniref:DUF1643 domain-containing protein n=1 Tax=Schlesneria sphaerica TaxID=3373610 RepID=UPI0037C91B6C
MVPFIPAAGLKDKFGIFGHFYSVEVTPTFFVECRSVLEIIATQLVPKQLSLISIRKPDAVFVMMNPGSSRPLVEVDNRIHAEAIEDLAISLVPTKPDTTQYQVMRLMHFCDWRHVRVLNLSDLRCSKSVEFFKQFRQLEALHSFDAHSLFSSRRKRELTSKLTRERTIPIVCAWGLGAELDPLIERCQSKFDKSRIVRGLVQEGTTHRYLHPLPSLQRQKLLWVNQMVEQLRRDSMQADVG